MSLTRLGASATLALFLGSAAAVPVPATAQVVHLVVVNVAAVALGYRASWLITHPVQNQKGEVIGRIDDMVIGRDKVLFAILSVGGFLGLADHKVVAPYASLRIDGEKIVWPGATKEAVRRLPEFHYR